MEILPVALPAVVGANCAAKLTLWPAPSVNGVARPLMLNPVPDAVACDTVTLADPEFVKEIVCEPLLPVATEPKLIVAGLTVSWPWTPVPDIAIAVGEFGALLTMESVPLEAPATDGSNVAVKDALPPAAIVIGMLGALTANPEPDALN
jgi:hypothetical protein